ncbi:hypothetical protein H4R18_000375 [Coemansia javaensis]|uniref:Uncharacterized protein n=1 Tax=Coemansia javaensis TaxID=2761396 RepID=A0A9W8LMW9_9FUNG|nr:hypothetical protein H4R18_000375 [Coemansia javaensis]
MARRQRLGPIDANFWDIFTLVFGAVLMLLNTILYAYAMFNHRYPPLRAKNLRLISVLWLCTLIWFIGIIGTNFNLNHLFGFPGSCLLFGLWFRILLGIFAFVFIHILRLYTYIRIFRHCRRVTYWVYVWGIAIYLAIILGYGIPMSVLQDQLTVHYYRPLHTCGYGGLFTELSFSVVWAGWAGVAVTAFFARNINTSFREYREMLVIIGLCSAAILYETITHHIRRQYTIHRWSRVISSLAEYMACHTSLGVLLGVPAYNCIFNREEYRRRFFRKMQAGGLASRYGLALPSTDMRSGA